MLKTITENNLLEFRDFIQNRTGLFFPQSKFFSIEKIIQKNFQESPVFTFEDYIAYLKSISGKDYLDKLISLLTTNETYFFRGKTHFDLLEHNILPELIQREAALSKTIVIWSAGCSTGEEPYSIAILLKKLIPKIEKWKIHIVATDIDAGALQKAKRGKYNEWSFRGLDRRIVNDCFIKKEDNYFIKEEYKSLVRFSNNNMISDLPPCPINATDVFDIIICRNVAIYFEKKTTKMLAAKFHRVMKENGYLMVGHAEHSAENFHLFHSRAFPDAIIYQKKIKNRSAPTQDTPILQPQSPLKRRFISRRQENQNPSGEKRASNTTVGTVLDLMKAGTKTGIDPTSPPSYTKQRRTTGEEKKLFCEAMQSYLKKEYEISIDCFLKILHINQANARACWMLAHIASNRGDFDEALAWSNRSIKIDPLFKEPYYTLSIIYLARGELDDALAAIKKAIYIDQNFILGHYVMGNIFGLMNRDAQKERCFQVVKDLLACKPSDEVIFEIENLTVGSLINSLECRVREK